ncbi:MAG: PqqD family protein [Myxococcales bacterium]|nr:PqqD family protein [Myxococcales bacterium]
MAEAPRYRASERALLTELGDGTGVLLDMDSKFYFTLNETAIFVWKQLAAPATLNRDELAARVSGEFDVDAAAAADDIDAVLEMLQRERLVTVSADGP